MAANAHYLDSGIDLPSKVERGEPTLARIVGLIGAVILLAALAMSVVNAQIEKSNDEARKLRAAAIEADEPPDPEKYQIKPPMFGPLRVFACWIFGLAGLLYLAFKENDEIIRRALGFFAYALCGLGSILLTLAVAGVVWPPAGAIAAAAAVAVLFVGLTAAPFAREDLPVQAAREAGQARSVFQLVLDGVIGWPGRWLQGLMTSPRVQQVTLVSGIFLGVVLLAVSLLLRQPDVPSPYLHLLGYGLACLSLGLVFLFAFTINESQPAWRDAAAYALGGFGFLAAAAGFASLFADFSDDAVLKSFLLPHGMTLLLIGLVLSWAYICMQGSESEQGHAAGWVLLLMGAAMVAFALTRSVVQRDAYFIPVGFLTIVVGCAYLFIGACFTIDWPLMVMTRRELTTLFYSPIAYFVIGGTALLAWGSFLIFLNNLVQTPPFPDPRAEVVPTAVAVPEPILARYLWSLFPIIFLIVSVPLVTMRLLSEEKKSGTLETLQTAPIGESPIVLSKFFGVWIFYMLAWGGWAFFPAVLRFRGGETFDYWPMISYFIGISAMAAGYLALGLFLSSLFNDQTNAFMTSLVAMFAQTLVLYFFIDYWRNAQTFGETTLAVLNYAATIEQLQELTEGKLYYAYLTFHLSACLFWLFLTVSVLQVRKWK